MNKKIKIAYLISTLESGGPVNVLFNIVKYLDKSIYEIHIITLSRESEKSRIDEFKNEKCIVHQLNLSRIEGMFKAKKYVQNIIDRYEIDIVHSHGFRGDGIACKLKNIKSISTIHNYPKYDYVMTYGKLQGIIMAKLHIRWMTKLNLPCACSKSVFDNLKNVVGAGLDVVQNGIDTQVFTYGNEKNRLRDILGLPKDKTIFISVGSIISRKDNKTILECFKNRDTSQEILVLLGEGDQYSDLKEEYEEYENIKFIGRVNNVDEYMRAANYYISASLAEGLPNTVLEALSSGLPCILSDIQPHIEIIEYDFSTARTFGCKNIKELNLAIDNIILKDYDMISYSCRRLIEDNLSAKCMSENYKKKYKKLLEKK